MHIRDLYRLKGIRAPAVSPDGKRVAFVRRTMNLEKGRSQLDLFVVGVDGKEARQLTRHEAADHSPSWSPDGRWLLFVSTREDGTHLWRLPLAGGDPEQLTTLSTGVSHPRYSPDGRRVAFVTRVYPEHPLDDAKNKARMKRRRKGPVKAHLADELLFRHWTRYDDGRRQHVFLLDIETRKLTDLTPGPHHSPPISLSHGGELAFSPDGRELCFSSNRAPARRRASSTNSDVYVVRLPPLPPADGGAGAARGGAARGGASAGIQGARQALTRAARLPASPGDGGRPSPAVTTPSPRAGAGAAGAGAAGAGAAGAAAAGAPGSLTNPLNLTRVNPAWDGSCTYSPDGRYLAYRMQREPGYESDRHRLALLERSTGKVRVLTADFDHPVHEYQWFPDAKGILVQAPVRGRWPLYRVAVPSGRLARLPAPPSVAEFHLAPAGEVIAFTHSTVAQPPELYAVSADGRTPRKLTSQNAALVDRVDFRPAESLWVPGADGRKIHVWVVKPHGFRPGRRYPLILNVHGGPQYQWSDSFRGDWQVYPAKGYVVAFPNTTGSTGYGQDFTAAISKDWGGQVYRDTLRVTDALAKLPYVDPQRLGIMGWSYGGYLTNWVISQTDRFKAAASMMGVYDLRMWYATTEEHWFPEWDLGGQPWTRKAWRRFSPSNHATKIETPTLILTGERDYRIPYTQSIALFTDLRKQGVPARLVIFSEDGHWPSRVKSMPVYYNAHLEWFHQYLGGGEAPWKTEEMVQNRAYGKGRKRTGVEPARLGR